MTNSYPDNWKEIACQVKEEAGWKCERCHHPNDPQAGYILTVHHLDHNPENNIRTNLAALCQRCHLKFQQPGFTNPCQLLLQTFMLGVNEDWLIPHCPKYSEIIPG